MNILVKYIILINMLLFIKTTYSQQNNIIYNSINDQLQLLLDDSYHAGEIVDVNKELGIDLRNRRGYYPIDDPYNTLSGSYIFYGNSNDFEKGDVIGIYKNGEIIWHSEPIIFYSIIADAVGTIDMNLDGKVEIIFAAEIRGTSHQYDDIWIFSWDGNSGYCLNAKDFEGNYIPLSMGFRKFSMDDLDGDGILEIRSHEKKDGTIAWSWNGQAYGSWETTPIVPFDVFQPATNAEADVKCEVSKIDSQYHFDYEIYNLPDSRRRIENFHIDHGLLDSLGSAPEGWKFIGRFENSPSSWNYNLGNTSSLIVPGQIKKGFKVRSVGLPKISNFYIQSERGPSYYRGSDVLIRMHEDIINNSFNGKTITPYPPPNPFIPHEFIDTLLNYNSQSYNLGWIQDQAIHDKYNTYFNNAKNYLNQNNNNSAKTELQTVLSECIADSSTVLTSEAFALLFFNTEYLISQIPDTPAEEGLPVKLQDSQGNLLQGGSLQYYDAGWKDAENKADGTFNVETDKATVSLRMHYAGASQQLSNVTVEQNTVTFQTVKTTVKLLNDQNELLDGGSVKYYASGWKDFGEAINGEVTKELLPKEYSFRMSYGGASLDQKQDIEVNPNVVFQTVNTKVQLLDSQGNLIPGGTVQYYASGWKEFGEAINGETSKELLPKEYSFRMSYGGASLDQKQDIGENSTVVFQTVNTTVQLKDSQGNLLTGGTATPEVGQVQYYATGWKDFGEAVNGEVSKELLPKEYSFRMSYEGASIDQKQDISNNNPVIFSTVNCVIRVMDGSNQPINNVAASYYASGWKLIGSTENGEIRKELLPKNYSFRVNNNGAVQNKQQDITTNNIVEFNY